MKRWIPAIALVAALAACGGNGLYAATPVITIPATSAAADPRVGVEIIDPADREKLVIAGTTADGTPLSTADMQDDVIVVNSWASWCAPCRDELPLLVQAYDELSTDGVSFLGIDVKDDPTAAADFLATSPYRSIDDREGTLLATIPGVPPSALPSTVIIDREGRLAARIIGPLQPGQLETVVDQIRNEA